REAGSDLTREHEPAIVVNTDEKRADAFPRALGIGETADHEFLSLHALRFQPLWASPGPVRQVATLGDDSFEALLAGFAKKFAAVSGEVVGIADPVCGLLSSEETAEETFALLERRPRHVSAVEMQEIENEVYDTTA